MTERATKAARAAGAAAAAILAATLVGGCGEGGLQGMWKKMWGPGPSQQVEMAFDTEDADRRREGITDLASHDWGLKEPYLKGYATCFRTDPDPLVRAAAIRALGRAGDTRYLPDLINALVDPSEEVRIDAAVALDNVTGDSAMAPLRRRAMEDKSEDVRAASARALRHYPKRDVFDTLVQCLSDGTFTVRYQAHQSLVDLTGRDAGYEPRDWASAMAQPPPGGQAGGQTKRPWWDWMGVTARKSQPPAEAPPAAARASIPAEAPGSPPSVGGGQSQRPWWDWFGVTVKEAQPPAGAPPAPAQAQSPATSQPSVASSAQAGEQSKRPWWDWMGVTVKKP